MISVHRLNGKEFFLNAELILTIESIPDTCITLNNGQKFLVLESIPEIVTKIVDYKYMIQHGITPLRNSREQET